MFVVCGVNAQQVDAQTGNIVYTTMNPAPQGTPINWTGFIGTTSNGGGFSGGNVPAYNPNTGTFMFGYTMGTVSYATSINYALAAAGSDIRVNGLKYSWEYLNQDMSRGTLTGNINITSNTGQVLQNYNYTMPQTTNGWTRMSGTETFNTQYAPSSLGNLNVSFTGKDDRWWAGYYGPQIRDIGVNLLYSIVTPAIPTDFSRWIKLTDENGTFTLNKTGVVRYGADGVYDYKNLEPGTYSCSNGAWGKDPIGGVYKACDLGSNTTTTTPTLPKTTTTTTVTDSTSMLLDPVTTTTTTSPTASTSPTTVSVIEPVTSTSTTTNTSSTGQPTIVASPVSAPAPATTTTSSTSSTSTSTSSTTTSSQTAREASSSGGGNVGLALSIISRNSERDAAGAAVAQSAVAQAQAAANQAQQEAASVATSAVSNSLSANAVGGSSNQQSSGGGIRANTTNNTNFTLQSGLTTMATVTGPQTSNTMLVQQQNSSSTAASISTGQQVGVLNTGSQQSSYNATTSFALPLLQPQQQTSISAPISASTQPEQQPQTQTTAKSSTFSQTTETYSMVPPNFLTDKTNPLTDIIENKQNIPQSNMTASTGPAVNRNAQDNDVASGVNISKMALAPAGYGDYLNFTLKDAAFYAPKEVYRNQRNVDNARALRQMMSDTKHREMVEQQYRR